MGLGLPLTSQLLHLSSAAATEGELISLLLYHPFTSCFSCHQPDRDAHVIL